MEKRLRERNSENGKASVDGLGLGQGPPKSENGGNCTRDGPRDSAETELSDDRPAIDEKDPNYVDEEEEEKIEEDSEVAGLVV
ncbi:hypothetical protein RJ641_025064 [Dillenia turbinata]|uniref:Uncharacterized protein n=1 Tax=Dillenia turbinata TaxID=194707 RepID=A0AAN8WDK6_9MAGN